MRLVNFAHPLTTEIRSEIAAIMGDFTIERYPAQFNLGGNLAGQVADLATQADVQTADLIVPPSLSAAAALLSDHFRPGQRPKIVWLKREDDTSPPRFVLGGIE